MTDKVAILTRLAQLVAAAGPSYPLAARLCQACVDILDVDGAAITIAYLEPERVTVASTDETIARLDDLQEVLGEGPGPDAYRTGEITVATLSGSGSRWPLFDQAASEAFGKVTVHAIPIKPNLDILGVLLVYQLASRPLSEEQEATQFLANSLGAALLREPLPEDLAAWTSTSSTWSGRARVHQATGMVIGQLGIAPLDAVALMRAHAYAHDTTLDTIAAQILSRELDFTRQDSSGDETR